MRQQSIEFHTMNFLARNTNDDVLQQVFIHNTYFPTVYLSETPPILIHVYYM